MIVNEKDKLKPSETGCFPNVGALWSTFPRNTRVHMEQVGKYADLMYQFMIKTNMENVNVILGGEFRDVGRWIFALHDVGRHYIPFALLNKVGKLTPEEMQTIKDHTVNARRAMKTIYIQPFSDEMMLRWEEISVYHHERFDGTGYPEGLDGEAIPLGARICAIADAYEGIISWKPYKKKQTTKQEAAEIIESEAGKQFQPQLVEVFKHCVAEF